MSRQRSARRSSRIWRVLALLFLVGLGATISQAAEPLSTAFEYQGVLRESGQNANGSYDFEFHLYDGGDPATATWLGQVAVEDVLVSGGLFAATLDFGQAVFAGEERWLEIHVRSATDPEPPPFTALSPLQRVGAVPYALFALTGNEGPAGPQGPKGDPGEPGPVGVDLVSDQIIDGYKTFLKDVVVTQGVTVEDGLRVERDLIVGTPSADGRFEFYGDRLRLFRVGGLEFGEISTNTDDDLILKSSGGKVRIQEDLYIQPGPGLGWRDLHADDLNTYGRVLFRNSDGLTEGTIGISGSDLSIDGNGSNEIELRERVKFTGSDDVYFALGTTGSDHIRFIEGALPFRDLDVHLGESDDGWLQVYGNLRVRGSVAIEDNLSKFSGSFKIDHPLDPENRYLVHSFVESPDMLNLYDGVVVTDAAGEAWVELPSYFDALNIEPRYQLTVIGQFAQAIVAETIVDNRFLVKTDQPHVEVSWQVTGVRNDDWARENRLVPEVDKSAEERGSRLYTPRETRHDS